MLGDGQCVHRKIIPEKCPKLLGRTRPMANWQRHRTWKTSTIAPQARMVHRSDSPSPVAVVLRKTAGVSRPPLELRGGHAGRQLKTIHLMTPQMTECRQGSAHAYSATAPGASRSRRSADHHIHRKSYTNLRAGGLPQDHPAHLERC